MEAENQRRSKKKVITKEVIAFKKMRELKNLSRKEAAPLVGVTFKLIEQVENGRVEITQRRIIQYCNAYGFSIEQFKDICEGRLGKIKNEIHKNKPKVIENNNLRRSYKTIITKEIRVLEALRKIKGISQDKASYLCGYSRCTIGHIENGRIEVSKRRIEHIVKSYGFKMKEFDDYMKSNVLRTDVIEECYLLLQKLSNEKLKTFRSLLENF
ncbi:MAG: helix-turn-helix transcriptional regulator [Bacteriovoracaceae bacterium]|nr:helix-turn-helix transcriptional regulator [Bacteriovoracaceae bacterium]